jgi:hypothetical protein
MIRSSLTGLLPGVLPSPPLADIYHSPYNYTRNLYERVTAIGSLALLARRTQPNAAALTLGTFPPLQFGP